VNQPRTGHRLSEQVADSCREVPGQAHYLYRHRELIVEEEDAPRVTQLLRTIGVEVEERDRLDGLGLVLLEVDEQLVKVPRMVALLHDFDGQPMPRVGPNHVFRLATHRQMAAEPPRPGDPLPPLPRDPDYGGRRPTVVVFDTGVDPDNAWLKGAWEGDPELPELDEWERLLPHSGHGTFVAGIVLQHAPNARVVMRRIVDHHGEINDFELARLLYGLSAGDLDFDVLNFSVGTYAYNNRGVRATQRALRYLLARRPNVAVVAAAGNDHVDQPSFPAASKQAIAVGAVDWAGEVGSWRRACFSNYGWWVDACAPGVDVGSAFFTYHGQLAPVEVLEHCEDRLDDGTDPSVFEFTGWANWSGTSTSAPVVAATIASRMAEGDSAQEAVARTVNAPDARRMHNLGTLIGG
jgi:Subtilase family